MLKEAVILFLDEQGLIPIFGEPAIKRNFLLLRQLGIKKIIVLGRMDLYERLSDISGLGDFIFCPANIKEDVLEQMIKGENVLLLKANHVLDKFSLQEVIKRCEKDICVLEGDGEEPVFIAPKEDLKEIIQTFLDREDTASFIERAKKIKGVAGLPYVLRQKKDAKKAEHMLIKALSLEKRDTDSFIAKNFDRNISLFFTKRLVHTSVSPNQITLTGMSIGLVGAFLLSFPNYWAQLLGAFLFLFCVIVDGVDGEIARLKLKESMFGHYLDIITDNLVHIAIFVGMGIGLYRKTGNQLYLTLIWVLLIGFGLCAISVYQCILKKSEEELNRSPFLIKAMSLLTNRDFAYLVMLLAIFDKLNWFFIMTAIGSYVFSLTLWTADYLYKKNYPADSSA